MLTESLCRACATHCADGDWALREGTQVHCQLLLVKPAPASDTSHNFCFSFYRKEKEEEETTDDLETPIRVRF